MRWSNLSGRLKYYLTPADGRFEMLPGKHAFGNITTDVMAGLITAATTLPLAIGIAMASGLRPEKGIIGAGLAALLGALFGGSKYQVNIASAAMIPLVGGMLLVYNSHFLALVGILSGLLLLLAAVAGIGHITERIPRSIVAGLTLGTALIIIFSQLTDILGIRPRSGYGLIEQLRGIRLHAGFIKISAVVMAVCTFIVCRAVSKLTHVVPAPLAGLVFGYLGQQTFWSNRGLVLVEDKFGKLSGNIFQFSQPGLHFEWSSKVAFDMMYYALAFVLIISIESLQSGRRADYISENGGKPFDENKELWGQGLINSLVPLLGCSPQSGNWIKTIRNIWVGAMSPLASIARFVFLCFAAVFLGRYVGHIPMACIAGILVSVSASMIIKTGVLRVWENGTAGRVMMIYTAAVVSLLDFMAGVISAVLIHLFFHQMARSRKSSVRQRITG